MNISERDLKTIWHPYTQMKNCRLPVPVKRGKGAYLYDTNGKKYIDAISSWWVNLHGHAHPYIAHKVYQQFKKLEHVIFADFTHLPAISLAEELLKMLPQNQSKIFYSDNGSTAVEIAVKIAIQYWHNRGLPKKTIVAFKNGYHGDTFGSMSVSARSNFTAPFSNHLFDVTYIDVPIEDKEEISASQLLRAITKKDIAAFIFEPLVQGAGGMIMYSASGLKKLIDICRKNKILTVADEVMTGFGRTGKYFASDYLKNKPDIICLSKGLTGGSMALGVTSCTQTIYKMFLSNDNRKTFFHGHSYTANPIACAAALASLKLLQEKSCLNNIYRINKQHLSFSESLSGHPKVKECRVLGTILAIEIKTSGSTSYFNYVRDKYYDFFLSKGILLRPLGNVIYILPPYCITQKDLDYIYVTILKALNTL